MTCTFYVFLLPTTFEKFGKALNLGYCLNYYYALCSFILFKNQTEAHFFPFQESDTSYDTAVEKKRSKFFRQGHLRFFYNTIIKWKYYSERVDFEVQSLFNLIRVATANLS